MPKQRFTTEEIIHKLREGSSSLPFTVTEISFFAMRLSPGG